MDFLQLVAEKTEEGFPGNPEGFLLRKPLFFKRADDIRPYGNRNNIRLFTAGRGLAPAVKTTHIVKGGFLLRIPPRQSAFPEETPLLGEMSSKRTEGSAVCG